MTNLVTYIPNPALDVQWETSPETWALMDLVGNDVAALARGLVPIDSGELLASIEARMEAGERGQAGFEVVAEADYGGFVEYGTMYMDAEPYLRPALILGVGLSGV